MAEIISTTQTKSDKDRIKELVALLNKAGKAYYSGQDEIMSNFEYDALDDELKALEEKTGIVMSDSPPVNVGYETLSELPKEEHPQPMLSLDKTKSVEDLAAFAGSHRCLLSWKLDGLTIVLTYRDGELYKAVTRGNGYVGEVITPNARTFKNLPARIPFKGELVIRGEAIIGYSDFERINESISDPNEKYKNPRNLCSGSVRQLNNKITAQRSVNLKAFALISSEGISFNSKEEQFIWLASQGFEVVEYHVVDSSNMSETVEYFRNAVKKADFPSDGLVLTYDDIAYGESLGRTAKFPRHSIAFKWQDETAATHLLDIEWSASRTGLINPVAIFEPVELEGTTVSRASVHNVSILKELELGIGDEILVYKANMIIPQIAENNTRSGKLVIPDVCPVCGGKATIESVVDTQSLYCRNPECQAKQVKGFELLVSRDALNIDGISEATLEKFIDLGFIKSFADIYHLDNHRESIVTLEGFGEKSYTNIIESVEKSRKTVLARFIYSLGIAGVGLANARLITRHFNDDIEKIMSASLEELTEIDGIGAVIANAVSEYFSDAKKKEQAIQLLNELDIQKEEIANDVAGVSGKTFVITGAVHHYENRDELKAYIESLGGKVASAVSSKTDYLINNDVTSTSGKNKKAKELNSPIISEEDFIALAENKSLFRLLCVNHKDENKRYNNSQCSAEENLKRSMADKVFKFFVRKVESEIRYFLKCRSQLFDYFGLLAGLKSDTHSIMHHDDCQHTGYREFEAAYTI